VRQYRFSPRFEHAYAGLPRRIANLFDKKLPLFLNNPYHTSFLSRKMEEVKNPDIWKARLTIHYRWTFHVAEDGALIFRNIGTHDILKRPTSS